MLGKLAEMTVRDFRGFMKECYPIAWEIIGVGGREDIISTLGSLIECNQEMGKPKITVVVNTEELESKITRFDKPWPEPEKKGIILINETRKTSFNDLSDEMKKKFLGH